MNNEENTHIEKKKKTFKKFHHCVKYVNSFDQRTNYV